MPTRNFHVANTSLPATLTDELAKASFAFLVLMAFAVMTIGKFKMDLTHRTHEPTIQFHSSSKLTQGMIKDPIRPRRPRDTIARKMFSIPSN